MNTTQLNNEVVADRVRRAGEARVRRFEPRPRDAGVASAVTIRAAVPADAERLQSLAALDSSPALSGDVLVAEVAGALVAAIELARGRMVADPFSATAEIVPLLELRAAQAGAEPRRRRFSPLRLHGAPARRAA